MYPHGGGYSRGSPPNKEDAKTRQMTVLYSFLDDVGWCWKINWRPVRESNPCRIRERDVS